MEMVGLESQEGDVPKRFLFFKPMSWLGQINERLTTGWLINSLTFFAQRTKLKHNRWSKTGVITVVTSN
jgi:hypothetical protein